jgi:MFS family permease
VAAAEPLPAALAASGDGRKPVKTKIDTFASLRLPDFRNLWIGNVLLFLGSQMRMVAAGYLAYEITSSPLVLGAVSVGFAVPMLVLSPVGGALADRIDQRRIVQVAQTAFAAVAAFIAITILVGSITWVHLFIASALQGAIWSAMVPARQAMIPSIVGRARMTNALALMAGGFSASTLAGPAIGGAIYAWLGPATTFAIVGAFGLSAVVLTGRVSQAANASPARQRASIWAGTVDALRYVRLNRTLLLLLVALAYSLLAMPFRLILPVFVVDVYHLGPEAFGAMASVMGVGSVASSIAVARLQPGRRGLLLACGGLLAGASILLIAAIPIYIVGLIGMLSVGVADALRKSLNQVLLLEGSAEEYHGRVTSLFMLTLGLMPLGVLPASAMAELLGGRAAGATLGGALLVVSLFVVASRRMRTLR